MKTKVSNFRKNMKIVKDLSSHCIFKIYLALIQYLQICKKIYSIIK